MEIAAPPGTALILEPGGLDALPIDRHQLADAQPEIAEGAVDAGQSQETGRPSEPAAADVDMDGDRNRVIVRRRGTKGGGFFARRKDAVAPVQPRAAPAIGQDIAIGEQLPEDVPPEEAAVTAVSGKERRRANNNKNNSSSSVVLVKPGYSSIRTGIIKLTPESMKCKLYCRGLKCVYCNPENWTEAQQAIRGLYSNWINEHILASARPTARNFDEFDLIRQFKRAKIKTVFNLQCVNEHDFCGPPLVAQTGFSYDPELLMRNKIFYYNFAIPDFGTLPSQSILNIVKVIWFSLRHGRVAIHCHAGLGRTGTLIACFLVWSQGLYTADAIDLVRAARPNSVQSVDQINVVEEFAYHMHKYGTALPSAFYQASNGISLRQLMCNQRQFLPNEEARQFTHIPKLLYMLGDRLLRFVFEQDGIHYAPPNGHHARSCTFGTICVNWRNAFTARGKLQVRQVVNLLARCSAFPYEKDQALINRFQQLSLVTIDQLIADMDVPQLVSLLNAFMESIKKPYCSRRALIEALGHFSPDNPTGPIPESDDEEEKSRTQQQQASTSAAGANDELNKEDVELVSQLVNPHSKVYEEADGGEEEKEGDKTEVEVEVINGSGEAASKSGDDLLESQHGEFGTNLLVMNSNILKQHQEGRDLEEAEASEKPHEKSATSEGAGNAEEEVPNMGQKEEDQQPAAEERHSFTSRPESAFQGTLKRHSVTLEKCAEKYGGAERLDADERLGDVAAAAMNDKNVIGQGGIEEPIAIPMSRVPEPRTSAAGDGAGERPTTVMTTTSSAFAASLNLDFGSFQFEHHDSHTNKEANLNADWQCIVFYVCNMLSYLTGENYDAVLDLLTFWFAGDGNRDVKQAIYCHMRDLFARNMRQQEQQAAEWRRRMGLPEKGNQQQQQSNKMN